MPFALLLLLSLLPVVAAPPLRQAAPALPPDTRFVATEGASLGARIESAVRRGRAADASHFWIAYGFDVRPGIVVDLELKDSRGGRTEFEGMSVDTSSKVETRNLAIFLLYERTTSRPDRVEVYNLDRKRGYDGYTVYWAGHAGADESLGLLGDLLSAQPSTWVAERSIAAIALHADPRADDMLESLARSPAPESSRKVALQWIGLVTDRIEFLASVARDGKESIEIRSQAALAIGLSSSPRAVGALADLYAASPGVPIREQIVDATGIHNRPEDTDAAIDLLIRVADTDRDLGVRRKAIFWLSQKAGARSMAALESKLESPEDDIQRQAVFAISQRPKEEAVPVLMRLARGHRSPVVQQQAIFWLGQIDDERVVPFLKELLGR